MKQLPNQLLLIMALATIGWISFYNLYLQDRYTITLRYDYPQVAESEPEEPAADVYRIYPEIPADEDEQGREEAPLTWVEFPLELNRATREQLEFIPRVGEVMSQRIIQYRQVLGGYTDLEQLREIKGVGDATFELLCTYLYLEEGSASRDEEPEEEE